MTDRPQADSLIIKAMCCWLDDRFAGEAEVSIDVRSHLHHPVNITISQSPIPVLRLRFRNSGSKLIIDLWFDPESLTISRTKSAEYASPTFFRDIELFIQQALRDMKKYLAERA